jgi:hypothetical protein
MQNAYLGATFSLRLARKADRPLEYEPLMAPLDADEPATALWSFESEPSADQQAYRLRNVALGQYFVHAVAVADGAEGEDRLWLVEPVPDAEQSGPKDGNRGSFTLKPVGDEDKSLGTTSLPPYELMTLIGTSRPDQHWRLSAYRDCAEQE